MISQILEKAVNKQLEAHQIQHDFLYQFQSDLWPLTQPILVLSIYLITLNNKHQKVYLHEWLWQIYKKPLTQWIVKYIMPKIKIYGRERCQMLWVLFILTGAKQLVNASRVESELLHITRGVPPWKHFRTFAFLVLRQPHVYQ